MQRDGGGWHYQARCALEAYDVGPDARLDLLCVSENTTVTVTGADGRRRVLRLHRPGYHSAGEVRSELAWRAALGASGAVSTQAALPTAAGEPLATYDWSGAQRIATLSAWVDGAEPPDDPGRLREGFAVIGGIAARLHAHARGWTPPPGFTRPRFDVPELVGPGARWGDWRAHPGVGRAERALLERACARASGQAVSYGAGAPGRVGLVHGDLRLANLVADPADPTRLTVVDFDDCGTTWFAFDLAASLSFLEHRPDLDVLAAAWLAGYHAEHPFGAADAAVVPALVVLRRLQLVAWTATRAGTGQADAAGPGFVAQTCELAERHLRGRLLPDLAG